MAWLAEKIVARRKIDIKNIESRFGGAKIGGERLPLARTSLLTTPSSGDTPQRPELGPKKSLPNVKSIVPPFWVLREILWSFCWREYNCEYSVFAIIYITSKRKGFNTWHVS